MSETIIRMLIFLAGLVAGTAMSAVTGWLVGRAWDRAENEIMDGNR